ncbi:MAG: hypothetical protein WA421_00090 [Nitrososphaeraceae archaeon]
MQQTIIMLYFDPGTANTFRKMLDLSEVTWNYSRVSQPIVGAI